MDTRADEQNAATSLEPTGPENLIKVPVNAATPVAGPTPSLLLLPLRGRRPQRPLLQVSHRLSVREPPRLHRAPRLEGAGRSYCVKDGTEYIDGETDAGTACTATTPAPSRPSPPAADCGFFNGPIRSRYEAAALRAGRAAEAAVASDLARQGFRDSRHQPTTRPSRARRRGARRGHRSSWSKCASRAECLADRAWRASREPKPSACAPRASGCGASASCAIRASTACASTSRS